MTDTPRRRGAASRLLACAAVVLLALLAWRVAGGREGPGLPAWLELPSNRPLAELPRGPVLERAVQRGRLIVGVRSYPRPAPPDAPTPPEPDSLDAEVARRLARTLGIELELIGLAAAEQPAALREGRVDLLLAGAPASADTGGIAAAPVGYAAGAGMLVALRKGKVQDLPGLRGQPVCVGDGSGYAGTLSARYGAVPRSYPSAVHAVSAFMSGECAALAEDADVLERLLRNEEWRFYRTLARDMPRAAEAAVRIVEGDAVSRGYLAAALRRWRADGTLAQAQATRTGNVQFEITLLKDGLVCHS